jgi:ABC-2 type transport system ATP-binding protein
VASGSPAVIRARNLTKVFHTLTRRPGFAGTVRSLIAPERIAKPAVVDVSFDVAAGELLALLGPNGAGKSTTIKMLTGILTPTAGEVRVAGIVPHRERERNAHNIGAIFGQRTQLWWDLPARHSFDVLRDIYGLDERRYRRQLAEFDQLLELSSFWDTRVRHLSLGQRVRCDLAAALLHDPQVVFLDEPTIGMDVVVKEQVREFLRHQVGERGRTVLLTTHDMTEVARLAERVVLINNGRMELDESLQEIRRRYGGSWHITVTLTDPAAVWDLPGIAVVRREGPVVVLAPEARVDTGRPPLPIQEALVAVVAALPISDITIEEDDLEDVMRAAYRDQLDDAVQAPT